MSGLDLLALIGDAMWIFALATIASGSRRLSRQVPSGARLPMQWGLTRKAVWRARKPAAFTVVIGIPLAVGLILTAIARDPALTTQGQWMVFLLRAFLAPLHLLIHWTWMRAAWRTLEAEGALKP